MESLKEIILAVAILATGGYFAVDKIHDKIRIMALEKARKGLDPLSGYTTKLTRISPASIEQGNID